MKPKHIDHHGQVMADRKRSKRRRWEAAKRRRKGYRLK